MRALTLYITHPEVVIDPGVPMPRWGLSSVGRARAEAFAARRLLPAGTEIFSSTEQKALDLAEILAAPIGAKISAIEAKLSATRAPASPPLRTASADAAGKRYSNAAPETQSH